MFTYYFFFINEENHPQFLANFGVCGMYYHVYYCLASPSSIFHQQIPCFFCQLYCINFTPPFFPPSSSTRLSHILISLISVIVYPGFLITANYPIHRGSRAVKKLELPGSISAELGSIGSEMWIDFAFLDIFCFYCAEYLIPSLIDASFACYDVF